MSSADMQHRSHEELLGRNEPVVVVDHVSMTFNMASERIGSLKEYAIKLVRRELMFQEFKALDDVSFTVDRGDVFGLMGTNGSGKSTMLKIVAGVLEPSAGSCRVDGVIAPLIELGAGFDMELSARENIYLNGALLGYSRQFMEEHFDNIVEFADVEGFLDMPMKNYSSGMIARIAFAIATEVVPDILIVDEVLSVGDFMFQEKCERRIRSLIEDHGVTVLIVSHDSGLIERLCNKAIWIEKGHTKAMGDAADVCSLYRVLGGHAGSPESVRKVQEIFECSVDVPSRITSTLYSESRYASAAKLAEALKPGVGGDVVLAPGDCEQICFIANSLAGLLECPLLLYRKDYITDSALSFLFEASPARVIFFENAGLRNREIAQLVEEEVGCRVEPISGNRFDEVALDAYEFGIREGREWSRTFLITHNASIADRIAMEPFTYLNKVPVFYHACNGEIGEPTLETIRNGACDELLVVGGVISLPDECLAGIDDGAMGMHRFCYKDGYEAGVEIAKWIMAHDGRFTLAAPFVVSALEPGNALAIGAYAAKSGSVVLLEDPQNLDSVIEAYDFLHDNKSDVEKLTFVGDSKTFNKVDRTLLAKALVS